MQRFSINPDYEADYVAVDGAICGEVYHIARNSTGRGMMRTPIARYYAFRPEHAELFNPHWRLDCYVKKKKLDLAPPHRELGELLVEALKLGGHISEPIWMSAHLSSDEEGLPYGDLYDWG